LTAEANCLFLHSTCQGVVRGDTRREKQSQLRESRSDADKRVGNPSVHVGPGSSTDDDFRRDVWKWDPCVEESLAEPPPEGRRAATAEYLAHQHVNLIEEGAWGVARVRSVEVKLMEDDNAAWFYGTQQGADSEGRVGLVEQNVAAD